MSERVEIKRGLCWWCRGYCIVNVHVKDGRLVKIEENREYPRKVLPSVSGCERARAAVEWFYHPDRLKFPLKRVGEKGEGKWEQIPWDQALDEIADKLKVIKEEYGAEAIATTCGTARTNDDYRARFFYLLGSPNIIGGDQICYGARSIVAESILGWFPCFSVRPETRCIVLLGAEPAVARRPVYKIILDAIGGGAKLIVIDPRFTQSASKATVWLQVRPGSDCALLMGMIKVIIDEKLYDRDFVEKWCYGFDKLVERLKEYELQKVAEITWLPANKIVEAARLYATNKPACFIEGMGAEHLSNNAAVFHARCILAAITGNLDVKGGEEFAGPHPKFITDREIELSEKLSSEQRRKQIGIDRFRLYSWPGQELVTKNVVRVWGKKPNFAGHQCQAHAPSLYRTIITGKPYPVKCLITLSSNPLVTAANTKLVYKALKQLELYVVMDFWMTPCAELADYVLPAASWLERPSHFDYGSYVPFLLTGERALPPSIPGEYDRRTDYDFWRGLGIRLGQREYWPWETLEEAYDYRLKPMGHTLKDFTWEFRTIDYKKYEKTGFATPTGKVELYSTVFEQLGYDPLPHYEEPKESPISNPELAKEYPLYLITGGRHNPFFHSEHRQIDSLRRRHPDPIVQINPNTASEKGIKDGDWVWIESPRGRIRMKCQYFAGIDARVIHAEHGWWFPELPGEEPWLHGVWESNINVLTEDEPEHCNQLIGTWPLRSALCKVYKVKTY